MRASPSDIAERTYLLWPHLEDPAFDCSRNPAGRLEFAHRIFKQPIECHVVMRRIVVEWNELSRSHPGGKFQRVAIGAMPPSDTALVFRFAILGIVDQ